MIPNSAVCLLPLAMLLAEPAFSAEPSLPDAAIGHEFDFWIGDWIVENENGDVVLGENRIEPILGGQVLHEHWRGASGFRGESLNVRDKVRGIWHQTWVDQDRGLLTLEGGPSGGSMVLLGRQTAGGLETLQRISWTPLSDGRVRQLWDSSSDSGKTWTVQFDGYYRRKPVSSAQAK